MKLNPADHVERWPTDRLSPYAKNARTHSEEQISQLAASIQKWGWTVPILVDSEGQIIAGHGRILAAKKLGLEDVPVVIAQGWTEEQKRMYVLADNKLALNAGWDQELLRCELSDLRAVTDLDLTGFSPLEIGSLLGLNPPTQKPTTKEVNPDEFEMEHKCPKCGFEFDD